MRKSAWGAGLAAIGSVAALCLGGGPASAAKSAVTGCDQIVVDSTHAFDDAAVRQAAERLARQAVDVRVVVFPRVPGTLDSAVASRQAACTTWQSPSGRRKNDLVIIAIAAQEKQVGVYYGSALAGKLDKQWRRLLAEATPLLRSGNETAGVTTLLDSLATTLDPTSHSSPPPRHHRPPGVRHPVTASSSSSSWVGVAFVGFLVVIAALIGGVAVTRRRRTRAGARAHVAAARDAMSEAFMTLDQSTELVAARVGALPDVDDPGLRALRAANASIQTDATTTLSAYTDTADTYSEAMLARASTAQIDEAEPRIQQATTALGELNARILALSASLDDLDRRTAELPLRLASIKATVTAARGQVEPLAASGFRTASFEAQLSSIEGKCGEVERLAAGSRRVEAVASPTKSSRPRVRPSRVWRRCPRRSVSWMRRRHVCASARRSLPLVLAMQRRFIRP